MIRRRWPKLKSRLWGSQRLATQEQPSEGGLFFASVVVASVVVASAPFAVRFRVRGSMLLRLRDASERRFEGRAAKYMHSATSLFAE